MLPKLMSSAFKINMNAHTHTHTLRLMAIPFLLLISNTFLIQVSGQFHYLKLQIKVSTEN